MATGRVMILAGLACLGAAAAAGAAPAGDPVAVVFVAPEDADGFRELAHSPTDGRPNLLAYHGVALTDRDTGHPVLMTHAYHPGRRRHVKLYLPWHRVRGVQVMDPDVVLK